MAVVTISRQHGSGGNEVAQLVCDQLGYQYFDKDLMTTLCDPAKLSCDDLTDLSEDTHRVQNRIERFFAEYPMSFEATVARYLAPDSEKRSPEVNFETVQSLIGSAYARGNLVLVGRGGQVILRDKPGVLHVRIQAPLDVRVGRVMLEEGLASDQALELVMQRDAAAVDYVKRFLHADLADPQLYDLVIDTRRLTPKFAAGLIVQAVLSLPA